MKSEYLPGCIFRRCIIFEIGPVWASMSRSTCGLSGSSGVLDDRYADKVEGTLVNSDKSITRTIHGRRVR